MINNFYKIIIYSLFISASVFSQENRRTLAVMDFDGFGMSTFEAKTLTERLRTVAVEIGSYIIVERGAMDEILEEQGFQQSGCTSDECIVEVGELMGVQYMLGGTIGKVGSTFTISMKIIDVESGEVVKTASYDLSGEVDLLLTKGMREAAEMIMGVSSSQPLRFAPTTAATSQVLIRTSPKGATVLINGENKGLSPTNLTGLAPGTTYNLSLDMVDHTPVNRTITLEPGSNPPVVISLTHTTGFLSVSGLPQGAKLTLGGKTIGILPLNRISHSTGQFSLVVKQPGFSTGKYPVNLLTGQEVNIDVNLKAKSKTTAMLLSGILPGAGQLYEGNNLKGIVLLGAALGAGFMAFNEYSTFHDHEKEYLSNLDLYNQETNPAMFVMQKQAVDKSFNNMQTAEKGVNTFMLVFGGVWSLNLVEIIF